MHSRTPNDIHDIDVPGSTLPYCDVVVTDKAVASHINHTGLSERLQNTGLVASSGLESSPGRINFVVKRM
jgi:hypothetical protein